MAPEPLTPLEIELLQALKVAQWGADEWCTACSSMPDEGHTFGCLVGNAIKKAEEK